MNLYTQKVLVRWLPSKALRIERTMTMGGRWGSEVQQTGINLLDDVELFSRAIALAEMTPDGRHVLQVGWSGSCRYASGGFVLDEPPEPAEGAERVRYYVENPTPRTLIEDAWQDARRGRGDLSALEDEVSAMTERFAKLVKDAKEETIRRAKHRLENEPNPLFDREAFDRVAHHVHQTGAPSIEDAEVLAAVPELQALIDEMDEPGDIAPAPGALSDPESLAPQARHPIPSLEELGLANPAKIASDVRDEP